MKQLSLGTKLIGGTATLLALVLAVGGFTVYALTRIGRDVLSLSDASVQKLELADDIDSGTSDILALDRGIILRTLLHDPAKVKEYRQAWADTAQGVEKALKDFEPLMDSERERALHRSIATGLAQIHQYHAEMNADLDAGRTDRAVEAQTTHLVKLAKAVSDQGFS